MILLKKIIYIFFANIINVNLFFIKKVKGDNFVFFKMISSLTVIFSSGFPYLQEGTSLGDGYIYNWLFISMRYLWGYVAPLILSFFTFKLCRIRSIQSATGVLYIVEFFVIVGELISVYLMTKHGLSL
jgi:hypothetical protein